MRDFSAPSPSPSSTSNLPIDHYRPIRAICIGAGVSGILTGIRFPQKIPNLSLTIYEKNDGLGGTWFENTYPGIACDIPSQSYSFTFENNPEWNKFYSSGPQILEYMNHVADKYGARKYMRFGHEFQGARWLGEERKWEVRILRKADGEVFVDKADVLVRGTGILNKWKWPAIAGLHDFQGILLHSANWDKECDLAGKKIAVIGNGSTGIQIVPALQPIAKNVHVYMRSKSWVSPRGGFDKEVAKRGGDENFTYSEEEKDEYRKDPALLRESRRMIDEKINTGYLRVLRNSTARQEGAALLEELVRQKLESKPGLFEMIRPAWPVGCKRLGASPGYLEALTKSNVEVILSEVNKVVANGIVDNNGQLQEFDAIVCATGFDTSYSLGTTPIQGLDNASLSELWTSGPYTYLGVMAPSQPNFFTYLGPNGAPMASMVLMIEFQCAYMIKCIQKLQREHYSHLVPKATAIAAFTRYADEFFAKTVLTEDCASWFKRGEKGRVEALWPGGLPHAWKAYEHPRWEDFEYQQMPESGGSEFAWFGNGMTSAMSDGGCTTGYLDIVDSPPIDPRWKEASQPKTASAPPSEP